MYENLAECIKDLRKKKKYSMRTVERICGVTAKTVSNIEKGYILKPRNGTVELLAEVFEVNPRIIYEAIERGLGEDEN